MEAEADVRLCSYNIQYGIGKDGAVDVDRIAADIDDADLICVQEIERYFPETGGVDQVALLAELFPAHHWVFTPGVDLDADERTDDGLVLHRRRCFGNMLLSRTRVSSVRGHLLPKHNLIEQFSLQRVALEAIVDTSSGPLRVVTTHLAHASASERTAQIVRLRDLISQDDGGAWSGRNAPEHWTDTGDPPTSPHRTLLCGDFNLTPDSAEYELLAGPNDAAHGRLTGAGDFVDAWIASTGDRHEPTCVEQPRGNRPRRNVCLDYLFVTPDLADSVLSMWVDHGAAGSDHQPLFATLDL